MTDLDDRARLFNNVFNPFSIKTQKQDKVLEAFITNEVSIPTLEKVIKGVDLTQFINPDTKKTAFEEYASSLPIHKRTTSREIQVLLRIM